MISYVLLIALAGAPPGPPPNPNVERQALTHCLSAMVRADLKDKTAPDAFATKANAGCMAEEAAFRTKSIAADRAVGIRSADAEQNAKSEITDIRQNAVDQYKDYLESNTLPK